MNDKKLKEKMDALDTLTGGIVYGKEEVWDKLQARMDKKPITVIPVRYWIVAAAVLLAMVSIAPLYLSREKEVVHNSVPAAIAPPQVMSTNTSAAPAIATTSETNMIKTVTAHRARHSSKVIILPGQPAIAAPLPITQPIEQQIVTPQPVAAITPVVPHNTMKVVHINEIEGNSIMNKANEAAFAGNEAPTDFRHLPVLHINNVVKEEYEIKQLLHENRFSFGRNLFSRPGCNETYSDPNTEDDYHPHHLLKNIFNTQN